MGMQVSLRTMSRMVSTSVSILKMARSTKVWLIEVMARLLLLRGMASDGY